MTELTAVIKAPGEKLLRVAVRHGGGVLSSVRMSGDFFMYPEESIDILERALVGVAVEEQALIGVLEYEISHNGIELAGVSAASIARAICAAK